MLSSEARRRAFQTVVVLLLVGLLGSGCRVGATRLDSEIISLDDTWSQYVNHRLSFSIRFPKMMMAQHGSCKWKTDDGDHSYRPEPALVPVRIFEDTSVVYVAPEYYYITTSSLKKPATTGDAITLSVPR